MNAVFFNCNQLCTFIESSFSLADNCKKNRYKNEEYFKIEGVYILISADNSCFLVGTNEVSRNNKVHCSPASGGAILLNSMSFQEYSICRGYVPFVYVFIVLIFQNISYAVLTFPKQEVQNKTFKIF